MRRLAIFLLRCYQHLLSPLLPPSCRFEPTCSDYAIQAFRTKGFFRALALTAWRVLRCNPWGRGGYDPVEQPPAGEDVSRKGAKTRRGKEEGRGSEAREG